MASYCPKCGPGHGCICDPALSPSSAAPSSSTAMSGLPESCLQSMVRGHREMRELVAPSAAPCFECKQTRGHLAGCRFADEPPSSAAPDVAGPVAWRWRPRGATVWQYDPLQSWLDEQTDEYVEREPLYSAAEVARLTRERDDAVYDASTAETRAATAERERDEAGKVIAELVAAKDAGDAESRAFNKRLQRGETVMMNWTWTSRINNAWAAARAWLTANEPAKGEG